ncbi:hypothetical protein P9209_24490 [Prescottella defluvii]|nr:hypothetical protein P9209_24490 [Prescottella defluvii]
MTDDGDRLVDTEGIEEPAHELCVSAEPVSRRRQGAGAPKPGSAGA